MSDLISRGKMLEAARHIRKSCDTNDIDDFYSILVETIKVFPSAKLGTNLAEVGTDCISRQAAIDAVNAYLGLSAVSRTIQNMTNIQEILERLPSAQPEIIRCKDCKYGMVDDPEIPFLRFCEYNGQDWNDENHYCGHAKRREVTE